VVIAWPDGVTAETAGPLLAALRETFVPSCALVCGPEATVAAASRAIPFARDKVAVGGKATAYVCRQGRCDLPVTEPVAFAAQLRAGGLIT
jgi:uncharacterized protein YyaL (SSP411 family)